MKTLSPRVVPILFAWLALASAGLSQNHVQIVHGQRPPAAGRLRALGRYEASTHLNLALGLPLRNREALDRLLHDLYDPASARYHQFLTSGEFAERFGPGERDYQEVIAFATARGLEVTGTHPNRMLLDVKGSVADVERALHVRMEVYQHPSEGRTFHAPDADPSLDLAVPILGINGLDDFVLPHPMSLRKALVGTNVPSYLTGSGPYGYFVGEDFRAAYAPGVALNGAGQSVGLFELDGYYASDIAEYEALGKLPHVPLTNVMLDGFNGVPGGGNVEVALDIDMAICMAPGLLQVIVYEGRTPNDILNRMATDNSANQLSCSWGGFQETDPVREQIYEQFAAQGQTMFQASGDSGAYVDGTSAPSDDPNLTVAGGTALKTSGPGGAWLEESAWSGSGGGVSTNYPLPAWQEGLATSANQGSASFRNIPDVAALADGTIWMISSDGQQFSIGGTSASAPLWAGFAALANQQAAAQGRPRIGFLNPTLYAIGRGAGYGAAMHDITTGNNTNELSPANFFAVSGYDLCTGWGTPAGSNLINALVAPPDALQIFPAMNLTAAGGTGGPFFPAAQNMVLTNIGTNALNWAAGNTAPWLNVFPGSGALASGGPGAVVALSLDSAASNLPPGSYAATLWFTNQNDGVAQSRQWILNVAVTSSVPVIVSQPQSQTAPPGAPVAFTVSAAGNAPMSYQWQKNSTNLSDGGNISGSTNALLTVNNVSAADAGTYSAIVSNSLSRVVSAGAVLTVASVTAAGVTLSTLYSFTGAGDGGNPNGLMQETNGNFYGTTQNGGANFVGTIFQMTPVGAVSTLFTFDDTGGEGFSAEAGLAQGTDGNLYGTTAAGGGNGWGTIFKTTTNGNVSGLVSLNPGIGVQPDQSMIPGADGKLYGTTPSAGAGGDGNVFSVTTNGSFAVLASFNHANGSQPNLLTQGADGGIHGTTFLGGSNGDGVIFNIATNGMFGSLFQFSYTNGGYMPAAGLTQTPDGTFYGTTYEGGAFGYGTVFAVTALGAVSTLYPFTGGNDGGHPAANFILASDGNFYGTTAYGGAYGDGTVFRMAPGEAPVTLAVFDGYNGANPETALVQGADGNIYGTTQNGGAEDNGVIFRVNINAPSVQITGQPADQAPFFGANAVFSVAVEGNPPVFYQWRKNGVNLTDALNISGSTSRVLTVSNVGYFDVAYYSVIVSNAAGSAASDEAFLEVVTAPPEIVNPPASQTLSTGGTAVFGVVAAGDEPLAYQWQFNQVNLTNGANVSGATTGTLTVGGLTQLSSGTYAVIVRNAVGSASADAALTVYGASAPGTALASIHWFTGGSDGGTPNGLAVGTNGLLYGTTQAGGCSGGGTVFSITTNGVLTTLVSFDGTNGSNPQATVAQGGDGNLHGTTAGGGSNSEGTIFKMTPGGAFTSLYSFSNGSSVNPYTALVEGTNGSFYGATGNGNASGDGNIFEMATDGTPSVLYAFTNGADGNAPTGALAQGADGNFYGMTTTGASAFNDGGVFRMTPGGALTNIYSFTGVADGKNPQGALAPGSDGCLYGVTGVNTFRGFMFYGTIFKVSTHGALTTLYTLNPFVTGDGAHPSAGLIQAADGNFYGTTPYNPIGFQLVYNGTLFRYAAGGAFTTLAVFNGADDGAVPASALVQGTDGALYGTTTAGGPYGKGSIFRLAFTSAPQITTQPVSQTNVVGDGAVFSVAVFGAPTLNYQWQFNGTNLTDGAGISGSASRILVLGNLTGGSAGTYTVMVSNALGSVTSAGAVLTVETPPAFESATQANGTLTLTWSATAGRSYQVQTNNNLAYGNWNNFGGAIKSTNSSLSASWLIGPGPQQFYRVVMLP